MATTAPPFEETTETAGGLLARVRGVGFTWARALIVLSSVLLMVSVLFEYWALTLHAPQYPGGLEVTIYTHKVVGDVTEVDGLNHYIGMMPLGEAAEFERTIATPATLIIIALGIVAAFLRPKWSAFLAAGVVLFPIVFAADLYFWLYRAGNNLDPTAAIELDPFTPPIVGEGFVGQFSTTANFQLGWWIAAIAAVMALAGIIGRIRTSTPDTSS
jgi:hypothetical protein